MTTVKNKETAMGKKRGEKIPKLLIATTIIMAAVMLSLCAVIPFAEIHNDDVVTIDATSHRPLAADETSISTLTELQNITDMSGKYILTADIIVPSGYKFRPIGYNLSNVFGGAFNGSFDGNGYTISGMNVGDYGGGNYYQYAGLFAQIGSNGKVSNVGLVGGSMESTSSTGNTNVGSIAGLSTGVISNCYNTGSVKSLSTPAASSSYAGGIVGYCAGGTIADCYNTGSVTATSGSTSYAGGIAGMSLGKILNCYNTGSVIAYGNTTHYGGIIGRISDVGGAIEASTCLYLENCAPGGNTQGTMRSAEQLRSESTYPKSGGTGAWDFTDTWTFTNAGAINNGLPFLKRTGYLDIFITQSTGDVKINAEYTFNVDFTVNAVSGGGLTFRWEYYDTSSSTWITPPSGNGIGTRSLSISPLNYTSGGDFHCVISNAGRETVSETMTLTIGNVSAPAVHYVDSVEKLQFVGNGNTPSWDTVAWNPNDTYIQTRDLVIPAPATPGGSNFTRLPLFKGVYDGNGFTITNMIVVGSSGYTGMFSQINGGTVMNLGLIGGSRTSTQVIGGIAGYLDNGGKIINCYNTGSVTMEPSSLAASYAGGIVGYLNGGTVADCYNTGSVTSSLTTYAGGIVGHGNNMTIDRCYNTGTVTVSSSISISYAGGILGDSNHGSTTTISDCYNTGSVSITSTGEAYAGGIVGTIPGGTIRRCYNTGSISITNATDTYVGGLIGADGRALDCYYTFPADAGALSESKMRDKNTFVNWDFNGTWFLSPIDGYFTPHLMTFVPQVYLHPPEISAMNGSSAVIKASVEDKTFAQGYAWQKYSPSQNKWNNVTSNPNDPFTLKTNEPGRFRFVIEYGSMFSGDVVRKTISSETVVTSDLLWTVNASVKHRLTATPPQGYGYIEQGGEYSVLRGSSVTFNFVPEVGHALTDVFVNGASVFSTVNGNTYSISNVSRNITIVAEFSPLMDLRVNTEGLAGDSITMRYVVNGKEVMSANGELSVPADVPVDITFTYGGDKKFQRWRGDFSTLYRNLSFRTPVALATIIETAVFIPSNSNVLTVTYAGSGVQDKGRVGYMFNDNNTTTTGTMVFINNIFSIPMKVNESIKLIAIDSISEKFKTWSDPYDSQRTIDILGTELPLSITIQFTSSYVPPRPGTHMISAYSDDGSTMTPDGAVSVSSGNSITFNYQAKEGCRIVELIVDGIPQGNLSGTYTFENVRADHSISIRSERISYKVTVEYNDKYGYIEVNVNDTGFVRYTDTLSVTVGSSIVLKATAFELRSFKGWTGSASSKDTTLTVTNINDTVTLRAEFSDGGFSNIVILAMILIVATVGAIIAAGLVRMKKNQK